MTTATRVGHIEPVQIHFDDLDAMGVVHNSRYVLLLERALSAFWTRHGWPFDPAGPHFADIFFVVREFSITYTTPIISPGPVAVHFWLDHIGRSSLVYGFRVLSEDHATVHAEGRRVQVKIDRTTLQPTPIGPGVREAASRLLGSPAA
ncbi:acyl-CoA thioester hydrolase [Thermocatellispora tengchongensis]|uniref:Acyl-CoA thioester hydrolase n=1 Tax=Thermocatellispora tengchongensis TaxID=1073253 RepID=A0A840P170_9ACTN|nr:thioesterase family protein [Thermocatellispora tengchongensis]MBB5130997.1 acyl-CoA thioester hydrolase [Thermocatellispora tengchongensis]